ncbi:MAG: GHKL domain-containing protein, partial [Bacteroidia bacterium]|nr:GHKL domain-containing protein [Bacteroidia bacterium]
VWEIFEDSKQNLWVGTISNGLDQFDRKKNIFYHYRNGDPDLNASDFSSSYVSALAEDKAGNILVGTSGGLEILNTQTKRFAYYTLPLGTINSNILDIKADSRGLIWIATHDGLNLFDPQKKTFKLFRKQDGLPDEIVFTILEDNLHNLWMSTPKGLCNMIIKEDEKDKSLSFRFKNYDETDGLQGSEFNENAAFKTKQGELVFGGPYGINIFKPDNIIVDQSPPGIILTDFRIFDKSVIPGEMIKGRIILPQAFSETKVIRLKYDENFFSIQFSSLDFSQAKKTGFEYMLEGFNKDWVVRSSLEDNKATYTNLDPGVYTFKIKAVNSDGISSKILSVQITIIPPFWMTWWFRLSILIAIAGGAFMFFRFRIMRIHDQKIKLQELVSEQTWQLQQSAEEEYKARQETEEANKELERKNKELEQFAYVASHDMQEPLRTTSSFVELLQQQYEGKLDEKADKYLTFIAQSSERMKVLIKDLLDYSRIGRSKELAKVDCKIMLDEVLADLGAVISETGAQITAEELPAFNGYPTELKLLFQNLIINAIKFAKKNTTPEINISVKKLSGYWQFAFKDNGIGIEEQYRERIFIIFQRLHNRKDYEGSGIGLSHCKKIVEMHKGKLWVDSTLGEGSTFYFTLPSHLI